MIFWRESHIWSRNELLFSNYYNNDLKMSLLSFKRGIEMNIQGAWKIQNSETYELPE